MSEKNFWVDLVLLLCTGIIGVHKFYEGKIGMGILYIFTGGLFGIGLLVDFIKLLTNNATDKQGLQIKRPF